MDATVATVAARCKIIAHGDESFIVSDVRDRWPVTRSLAHRIGAGDDKEATRRG